MTRVACIGRVVLFTVARRSSSVGRRHRLRTPRGIGNRRRGRRGVVVDGGGQLHPRHPVDGGVMRLGDHREAARRHTLHVVQPFDDVELPQRPVEIERTRDEASHLDAQLPPVTRRRQRDVTNVKLEVEVGILDPVGVVEVERHPHQPLAKDARLVQPLVDVVEDPLERDPTAVRGRRVVDRQAGPRHVRPGRLGVEKRGIHSAQLLHRPSPRFRGVPARSSAPPPQSLPLRRPTQRPVTTSGRLPTTRTSTAAPNAATECRSGLVQGSAERHTCGVLSRQANVVVSVEVGPGRQARSGGAVEADVDPEGGRRVEPVGQGELCSPIRWRSTVDWLRVLSW